MNFKCRKHEENYTKVVHYNQINQTSDKEKILKEVRDKKKMFHTEK